MLCTLHTLLIYSLSCHYTGSQYSVCLSVSVCLCLSVCLCGSTQSVWFNCRYIAAAALKVGHLYTSQLKRSGNATWWYIVSPVCACRSSLVTYKPMSMQLKLKLKLMCIYLCTWSRKTYSNVNSRNNSSTTKSLFFVLACLYVNQLIFVDVGAVSLIIFPSSLTQPAS